MIPREREQKFVSMHFFQRAGFSLIEVVLALGILGLAFVPLMGLLPAGMDTFRSSVDRSAAARVVEQLANEARQSEFKEVRSSVSDLYFDELGNEVQSPGAAIFQARLTVLDESPHLKRLVIQVVRNPDGRADLVPALEDGLWKERGALPVTTRSVLLARFSTE